MIIRLNGADFSENNIGTIKINKELGFIKDLLSNYSRPLTIEQKFAVQDFIIGIKSKGIWDFIENLYIPCLAGNLSETLYNVKTNTLDTIPSEEFYFIEDYGLRTKYYAENTTIPLDKRAIIKVNASYMNLHFMAYTSEIIWDESNKYAQELFITAYNGSNVYKGLEIAKNKGNNTWNNIINGNPARYVQSRGISSAGETLQGFIMVSCGGSGECYGLLNNEDVGQLGATETVDTTMTDIPAFIGCNVFGYAGCSTPMKIISTGSAMSKEMMKEYGNLCNTLNSKICN